MSSAFARNLLAARERAGLTRKALAARCGCTPQAVRYFERGERLPSWETLAGICQALGVLPSELIGGGT